MIPRPSTRLRHLVLLIVTGVVASIAIGACSAAAVRSTRAGNVSLVAAGWSPSPGEGTGVGWCSQWAGSFGTTIDGNNWAPLTNGVLQTPAGPLYACNGGETDVPDPYDSLGFICTELSQRYLFLEYGIVPYLDTFASDFVGMNTGDYNPRTGKPLTEGFPQPGSWLPAVGDIVSFQDGATPLGSVGHTAVVIAVSTSENTFTVLSQNWFGPPGGERIAAEQTWSVGPQYGAGMSALDGAGTNPTSWLNLAPMPSAATSSNH